MQGFLPIRCLNQYCMWEREISHQDCIHHGLIIRATYLPPLSREMELNTRKPGVQYLFHIDFPTWKKKKPFWVDFFKFSLFFFSTSTVQNVRVFFLWRNDHPVARIHENYCAQRQISAIFDGSGIIYQTEKTGCFRLHRAAIHFQKRSTSSPNIDFITKRLAMQTSKRN